MAARPESFDSPSRNGNSISHSAHSLPSLFLWKILTPTAHCCTFFLPLLSSFECFTNELSDNRIVRMGEAAKKICLASLKDQSCHVFGNAKGRTKLDLDLKLGISNIYSSQARDNHYNNHTFNQVEKNFIHGSSSTHDAGVNFNTNQTYEGQASKPGLNFNMATKMEDPKRLRRIMANRVSSKRYRLKKLDRMDQLEKQIKVIRAPEIGKNREEVKRLRELHINQLQANAQPTMPNSNDGHTVEEQLDLNLGL
ncbi:hypothetical protein JHK85_023846 [Glycine max]|nr:hypothetical protein JHK85_023846 [Glycine max]